MKLLDIINIISDKHKIKLSIDGTYTGTFEKGEITYADLNRTVKTIWPEHVEGKNYICLYLV